MEKKKIFIVNILYYGIILFFCYLGLKYLMPVLVPFIVAFLVVWLLNYPADFLSKKLKVKDRLVLKVLLTVFYGGVAFGVLKIGANVFPSIGNYVLQLPEFYTGTILPAVQKAYQHFGDMLMESNPDIVIELEGIVDQVLVELGSFITSSSGNIIRAVSGYAASVPSVVIKIIITIISSYFIAGDYEHIIEVCLNALPGQWGERIVKLTGQTKNIIGIFLKSYSLLMLITFCELFLGLFLLGIPHAGWISLLIAVFDILPILGTGGILIPWAIVAALLGDYKMAIGIAVLYLVITVIRNTLEPKLVGKQIGVHPLATLISMFVGARLFGLMGLVGFPLALSIYVKMKKMENP